MQDEPSAFGHMCIGEVVHTTIILGHTLTIIWHTPLLEIAFRGGGGGLVIGW